MSQELCLEGSVPSIPKAEGQSQEGLANWRWDGRRIRWSQRTRSGESYKMLCPKEGFVGEKNSWTNRVSQISLAKAEKVDLSKAPCKSSFLASPGQGCSPGHRRGKEMP